MLSSSLADISTLSAMDCLKSTTVVEQLDDVRFFYENLTLSPSYSSVGSSDSSDMSVDSLNEGEFIRLPENIRCMYERSIQIADFSDTHIFRGDSWDTDTLISIEEDDEDDELFLILVPEMRSAATQTDGVGGSTLTKCLVIALSMILTGAVLLM